LETVIDAINLPQVTYKAKEIKHLRQGQAAEILANNRPIGTIGRISDEISAGYKFKQPVYVAEIDLQTIFDLDQQAVFYKPLPKLPAVIRDVSLLVKRTTTFTEILQVIELQGFELCQNISFVDVYEGKGVADNERSITIRLEYRSEEKTLIEAEVEEIHAKILTVLKSELDAKLRF
jgi:phenylalanyl-tRNA synthetase beta chain